MHTHTDATWHHSIVRKWREQNRLEDVVVVVVVAKGVAELVVEVVVVVVVEIKVVLERAEAEVEQGDDYLVIYLFL